MGMATWHQEDFERELDILLDSPQSVWTPAGPPPSAASNSTNPLGRLPTPSDPFEDLFGDLDPQLQMSPPALLAADPAFGGEGGHPDNKMMATDWAIAAEQQMNCEIDAMLTAALVKQVVASLRARNLKAKKNVAATAGSSPVAASLSSLGYATFPATPSTPMLPDFTFSFVPHPQAFSSSVKKQYQCHLCPFSSAQRGNLNTHLLRHSGERPHMCSICGARFTTSSARKRHEKSPRVHTASGALSVGSGADAILDSLLQ